MAFFGFGRKEEAKEQKGCCAGSPDAQTARRAEDEMREHGVKVLGGGCSRCNQLEAAAVDALRELGMEPVVDHVRDYGAIAAYGVMSTPALVIDGKVVSSGRVPGKDEIIGLIRTARGC